MTLVFFSVAYKNYYDTFRVSVFIIILLLINSLIPALADGNIERTQQIKAAFIFNIARYVTWSKLSQEPPQEPSKEANKSVVKLCFLEKNSLGSAVNSIKNKYFSSFENTKLKMSIQVITALNKDYNCQILYLTQEQVNQTSASVKDKNQTDKDQKYNLLTDKNVLVIANASDQSFTTDKHDSVIIYLIRQDSHLGISINSQALVSSKLKLSSQLLKLSKSHRDSDRTSDKDNL